MTRTLHRLSVSKVRNAALGMHADGGNLYLQCTAGGDGTVRKSWLFRFTVNGRERQAGLGALDTTSLAEAREKALACRKLRAEGIDPIEHRRAAQAATALESTRSMTFDQCAQAFIKSHAAGWRNLKHHQQWQNTIRDYCIPTFGKVSVQNIDTALVMRVLEPLWSSKPETASRVRGRIESILDWARVRGFRSGENPARWRGHLDHLLPARKKVQKVKHLAALPYVALPAFMTKLRNKNDGVAALALEFTILTAVRAGATIRARWDEIDADAKVWTVPDDRTKRLGHELRIPLVDDVLVILEQMREIRRNEFLFPGANAATMSDEMMLSVLDKLGHGDLTVHGFRSSFKTWATEQTMFQKDVIEMALGHAIKDQVEAAYQRGDIFLKRRELMSAWSVYANQLANAGGGGGGCLMQV
jgi:integrase